MLIEVPQHPDRFSKADLHALVRPAADGFLRSDPTKGGLLDQVDKIRRRQQRRPAWIPLFTPDGTPVTAVDTGSADTDREPDWPLVIAALTELGEVTVQLD